MTKKAKKQKNNRDRVTWQFSPLTRIVKSKKVYDRKKKDSPANQAGLYFTKKYF